MTNRNKRPRITVEGSLSGMVCTLKQASHLLEGLRMDYQLLTPEKRNQVKTFLLDSFSPSDGPRSSLKLRKLKQNLG